MKKKLPVFDYIRIISIVSVIIIHTTSYQMNNDIFLYIINQIVRFAVPVFIIMSGFLLYYSDSELTFRQYPHFLIKRFSKVLIAYIIWSLIYIYRSPNPPLEFKVLTIMLLLGYGAFHLYFIIIILQLYIIFPLLKFLIEKFPKLTLIFTFLITFYYQTAIYLNEAKIFNLPLPNLTISKYNTIIPNYSICLGWLFFFSFGLYLSYNKVILEKLIIYRNRYLIFIIWMLSLMILIFDSKITTTHYLSIKPSVFLYSIISFFALYIIFENINLKVAHHHSAKKLSSIINTLSSLSFFVYLSHVAIQMKIQNPLTKLTHIFTSIPAINVFIIFTATLIISFILGYIISLLPYSWILGCPKKVTKIIKDEYNTNT